MNGKIYADEVQLSTPLPPSSGGTGGASADAARVALEANSWNFPVDWVEGASQQNAIVRQRYIAPFKCELKTIHVSMETVNSAGSYTLVVTNLDTTNTMLSAASFNMNSLSASSPASLTLTETISDRQLAQGGRFLVQLTSDDAGFDGSGIAFSFDFREIA